MGNEAIPRRQPIPWAAPEGPRRSKAIGPSRQMKQPSDIPITRVRKMSTPKWDAKGMQAVATPRTTKAPCCMRIRLTCGISATFPKRSREKPDVAPMHMTRISPLESGNTSCVCFT